MIVKVTLEYAACDSRGCLTRALPRPKDFEDRVYEAYLKQIGWIVEDKGYTCPHCIKERSRIEDK